MILFILTLLACGSSEIAADTSPEGIAALAGRIEASPAEADALLSGAGLDRAAFESALYDIAMEPDASRRYLDAR